MSVCLSGFSAALRRVRPVKHVPKMMKAKAHLKNRSERSDPRVPYPISETVWSAGWGESGVFGERGGETGGRTDHTGSMRRLAENAPENPPDRTTILQMSQSKTYELPTNERVMIAKPASDRASGGCNESNGRYRGGDGFRVSWRGSGRGRGETPGAGECRMAWCRSGPDSRRIPPISAFRHRWI